MKGLFPIILMCLIILLGACEKDESFTVDSSSVLAFSVDTVSFDTVFTGMGSPTMRFKVYNKNDKGLRLANVRLASSGETGFRVNLDGVYGTDFKDVEIYHGDSLFVFVEVTPKVQSVDVPVEIKDSLIFTLENGREQSVVFIAHGQDAIVLRSLIVDEDMVLDDVRPYLVYDSLVVAPDRTLSVNAGVRIFFNSGAELKVRGRIVCEGTLDSTIVMRGLRTDKMFPYLPYDRLDAQWGGVHIYPESFGNVFDFVDIHGGSYGVKCDMSGVDYYKLTMNNSSVHNVASDALFMEYCAGLFQNCEFSNAKGNCVTLIGGYNEFVHCTMAQFYPWDASLGSALYFCNVKNDTIYPLDRALFANCYITGVGKDEVFGTRLENSDAAFNCNFVNCALRTDVTGEDTKSYFENCVSESDDYGTEQVWNFKCVDNDNYIYDFRLDSLSVARGVGNVVYTAILPYDKDGKERPDSPDAGCYQY